jgi:hypothetical protein
MVRWLSFRHIMFHYCGIAVCGSNGAHTKSAVQTTMIHRTADRAGSEFVAPPTDEYPVHVEPVTVLA